MARCGQCDAVLYRASLLDVDRWLALTVAAAVAVPTALTIIVVPFMQVSLLLWVLGHARRGCRASGFRLAMRMLTGLRPWSMVEVAPGAGIWTAAALMILITIVASRDIHWFWDFTDSGRPRGEVGS